MAQRVRIGRLQHRAGIGVDDDGRGRRIVAGVMDDGGAVMTTMAGAGVGVPGCGGGQNKTGQTQGTPAEAAMDSSSATRHSRSPQTPFRDGP